MLRASWPWWQVMSSIECMAASTSAWPIMRKLGRAVFFSDTHQSFCRDTKLPSEKVELAAKHSQCLNWARVDKGLPTVALQALGLQLVQHANDLERLLAACIEGVCTADGQRCRCLVCNENRVA